MFIGTRIILIKTYYFWPMGKVVKSWKSYSAKAIRKYFKINPLEFNKPFAGILYTGKPFWQREYWDRFIRNEHHFNQALNYVHNNPLKAGLCENIEDWPWSSAYKTYKN